MYGLSTAHSSLRINSQIITSGVLHVSVFTPHRAVLSVCCRDVSAYAERRIVVVPALHIRPHPLRLNSQAQHNDGPAQVKQGDLLSGEHFPVPGSPVHPQQVKQQQHAQK